MVNIYVFRQGSLNFAYPIPKDGSSAVVLRARFVSVTSQSYISQYRRTIELSGVNDVTIIDGIAPDHHSPREGVEKIVCNEIRRSIGLNPHDYEENNSSR